MDYANSNMPTRKPEKDGVEAISKFQCGFEKLGSSLKWLKGRVGRQPQSPEIINTKIPPGSSEKLTQNEDQGELTEFHLFPLLPREIRLMIWEAATQYKRRVVLHAPYHSFCGFLRWHWMKHGYDLGRYREDSRCLARYPLVWTSPTPPPRLLSVCSESRHVAQRAWERAFGFGGLPGRVWINFTRDDVVFIPSEVPTIDFMGGERLTWLTYLPGLRDFAGGRRGWLRKPVSMLAEVWQATPDLARVQRMVVLNNINFVHVRIRFKRNKDVFRSLQTLHMVCVGRKPGNLANLARRLAARPGQDEVLLTQGGNVWVMGQTQHLEPTAVAVACIQFHDGEDPWDEEVVPQGGLQVRESILTGARGLWLGYGHLGRPGIVYRCWHFKSPFRSYAVCDGVVYT